MRANPITATVDFERDGVQHGFLKLPHSHDGSAWGAIMIPVTVLRNGAGPTALLSGGNHGDEYEGPIALFDLAATLQPGQIRGRVIIVPAMNYPAFRAGGRTSPIDGGNMNRVFPGRPDGGPTEKIADYFQRTLLPMADYVMDIHSGGNSLCCLPFCSAHVQPDKENEARCVEAMLAFGAPYSVLQLEIDSDGMYDTAAERMGKVFLSSELGGGGTSTAETARIARRGVANFLKFAGILEGRPERSPTTRLSMPDTRCFVEARSAGLVEFTADLGEYVAPGQTLARLHEVTRTGTPPEEYRAECAGVFIIRRCPGLAEMGDILAVVAPPDASAGR